MSRLFNAMLLSATVIAAPALAAPIELKMLSPSPARSPYNAKVLAPWAEQVTTDSNGALKINFIASMSLATHRNIYDRVTTNVIPIGWGLQSSVRGQFPKSEVAQLPLLYDTSLEGSLAIWRLYQSGLIADEYGEVKLITVFSFPQNGLHAREPIPTLERVQGMKIGAFGALRIKLVKALGATPIAVPPPGLYQALSRGLVSGIVMAYSAFPAYKLHEVTTYHLDAPLGGNPGMVFMNKEVYAKLPAAAKAAIDSNVGESLSRSWATTATGLYGFGRKLTEKAKGHTFAKLSDADRAVWSKRFKRVYDEWAAATKDGPKVLAAFRAEVARIAASGK